MKHTLILFVLLPLFAVSVFTGCMAPKYYVVQKRSEIKKETLDSIPINYIPLDESDLANSVILDSTYKLLTAGDYGAARKYLGSLDSIPGDSSDWKLATLLVDISRGAYQSAWQTLRRLKPTSYPALKDLLTIDLTYEYQRENDIVRYKALLSDYQKLTDAYPEDELLRKIVFIRSRYLRYKY